jgi:membrane protease YdiL (CAAX protease family)
MPVSLFKMVKYLAGERLPFDWKIVTITIVSTLLLMVDHYHRLTSDKGLDRTILYLAIPLIFVIFVFREDPREYGLTPGDWKAGGLITGLAILLIAPVLWLAAHEGTMHAYYERQLGGLPWNTFVDLLGWEFFFRGWILFGYARRFGPEALWLQAVPFALAHIGKPEVETLSTIFGGFVFGWIAYRTKSVLYPFLLHWFIASFTILVAAEVIP